MITAEPNCLPLHDGPNCTVYNVSNDIYPRHESNFPVLPGVVHGNGPYYLSLTGRMVLL
jgi:hypothetical protein